MLFVMLRDHIGLISRVENQLHHTRVKQLQIEKQRAALLIRWLRHDDETVRISVALLIADSIGVRLCKKRIQTLCGIGRKNLNTMRKFVSSESLFFVVVFLFVLFCFLFLWCFLFVFFSFSYAFSIYFSLL